MVSKMGRSEPITRLLLWGSVLVSVTFGALMLLAPRLGVLGMAMPAGRCVLTLRCLIVCYSLPAGAAALCALTAYRIGHSIRRQSRQTRAALRPLLARPRVAAPADLAALLRRLRLEGQTQVIDLDTPVALCCGLLQPRILLSTGLVAGVEPAELEGVVRHEYEHLRHRDPLRLVLVRALADALPAWSLCRRIASALPLAQELAADRAALAVVGSEALASALLKVGDALGPLRGQAVSVGGFSALDARIDQLLGDPVPPVSPSPRAVLPVVSVLALSPFLCTIGMLLWYVVLGPSVLWNLRQHRGRKYEARGS